MKPITKAIKEYSTFIVSISILLIIFYFFNYHIPKNNAKKTTEEFEKYCKGDSLVEKWILHEISITKPWLFSIPGEVIYTDKESDSMLHVYFPNINFPNINLSSNIKTFKCCKFNNDDYSYNMTEKIVFYGVIKDTLYFDLFELSLAKWNSFELDNNDRDSFSSLVIKKSINRRNKVVKENNKYHLYYRLDDSFKEYPYLVDEVPHKVLFNKYNNELQSQN